MKGTMDTEGAYNMPVSPASVLLATIAAPFAAQGATNTNAIQRAWGLLLETSIFLGGQESAEFKDMIREATTVSLDAAFSYVGLKSDKRRFRELLTQATNEEIATDLLNRSLKGERVFTPEITKRMKAIREDSLKRRNANAALQRGRKHAKKKRSAK